MKLTLDAMEQSGLLRCADHVESFDRLANSSPHSSRTRTVPARDRVRMLLHMSYQERPFCTIQRESIYEYYCKLCKPTAEDYPPVDQDTFWVCDPALLDCTVC